MVDDRVRILGLDEPDHPGVDEPRARHEHVRGVEQPGLGARHSFESNESTLWSASTRRTASVVARADKLAPAMPRIPRLSWSSSSSGRPRNCSYHLPRGAYSSGSAK